MVIDFTGPRMEVSYADDPDRPAGEVAPRRRTAPAPQRPKGPTVTGFVLVLEDMTFCEGAAYVTCPVGTVLELVAPSERDRKDLERFGKEKKPHTMVRWKDMSRCVPSRCVTRTEKRILT